MCKRFFGMMFQRWRAFLATVCVCAISAQADALTIQFEGVVNSVQDDPSNLPLLHTSEASS